MPTEADCLIAVNRVPQVGAAKVESLRRVFGSLQAAAEADPAEIADLCKDLGPKLARQVVEAMRSDFAAEERERAKRSSTTILTAEDAAWPKAFKALASPPLCLYCVGNLALLEQTQVAIVGTRDASIYGTEQAKRFALGLAEAGVVVTSGLARGIDSAAHEGALEAGVVNANRAGRTIAVIGAALDRLYPAPNKPLARRIVREGGLAISEYAFGRKADRQTFPARNRLVAALTRAVLVVETPKKGGTIITAEMAEALGHDILAVPGRLDWPSFAGNQVLIRDGRARLVTHPEEILERLGALSLAPAATPQTPAAPSGLEGLTELERKVVSAVPPDGISIDGLCAQTGLPIPDVTSTVIALQMRRKLRPLPGGLVARARA